jgi:hypothetical protein
MQQPLLFGIAGHNYLVLRNDNNTIVKELHGLATDARTGAWRYVGVRNTDILKVWEFNGPHFYLGQKQFAGVMLHNGTEGDVMTLWNKAEECIGPINDKHIPYPPLGIKVTGDTENSNSVAYTLALCMGLDTEHLGLITPGDGKNLLGSQ